MVYFVSGTRSFSKRFQLSSGIVLNIHIIKYLSSAVPSPTTVSREIIRRESFQCNAVSHVYHVIICDLAWYNILLCFGHPLILVIDRLLLLNRFLEKHLFLLALGSFVVNMHNIVLPCNLMYFIQFEFIVA